MDFLAAHKIGSQYPATYEGSEQLRMYAGIDLGATNIAAALVNEDGSIVCATSTPTLVDRPAQEIVQDIAQQIHELLEEEGLKKEDLAALGVGIPGLAYPKTGLVHLCPNLFWHQVPLKDMLLEYFDLAIHITNDANCAALAELHIGAFSGRQNAVLIAIGTGVGGGIILDGKLYAGSHGAAGEIGHMVLSLDGEACACGNLGCLERYTAAGALERSFSPTRSAKEILDAAQEGSAIESDLFRRYVHNLGEGIVSIINILDPEIIALGGGVSKAGDFLLDAVRKEVEAHLLFKGYPSADIVLAALGSEAGVVGAALYAKQEEESTCSVA